MSRAAVAAAIVGSAISESLSLLFLFIPPSDIMMYSTMLYCSLEHLEAIREDRDVPEVVFRRALHVVSEEARVMRAVECLREGDFRGLGEQMTRSHASLQEDYEVR